MSFSGATVPLPPAMLGARLAHATTRLDHHHQPGSCETLARHDPHSHLGRSDFGSRHSQRLPHRTRRREPAQTPPAFITFAPGTAATLRSTGGATRQWTTAGRATALWRARLPAVAHRHPTHRSGPPLKAPKSSPVLTDPVQANIIAFDPLLAGFVGIRTKSALNYPRDKSG